MQDKYDYLSEAKRVDYLEWKEGILLKIEQLEREQAKNTRRDVNDE